MEGLIRYLGHQSPNGTIYSHELSSEARVVAVSGGRPRTVSLGVSVKINATNGS